MASVSSHTFKLIVDGSEGLKSARQFRDAWEKEFGALGRTGKKPESLFSSLKGVMGTVGTVAAGMGLYLGTRQMMDFTKESIAMGNAQKDAKGALISTIGSVEKYEQAIAQARTSTRGMVNETQLAAGVNSMLSMHLASNSTEAARLAMAGITLTKVYAANGATYEKYLRLLSGGSLMLYDNFGLTLEMVNARKAEIQSTTDLSAGEAKLQAIRQLTLEQADRYNQALSKETVATTQAKAASDDFKASFGNLLSTIGLTSGVAQMSQSAFADMKRAFDDWSKAIAEHQAQAAEQAGSAATAILGAGSQREFFDILKQGAADLETFKTQLAANVATYGDYQDIVRRAGDINQGWARSLSMTAAEFYAAKSAAGEYNYEIELMTSRLSAYRSAHQSAVSAHDELAHSAKVLAYQMGQVGQVEGAMLTKATKLWDEHNKKIVEAQKDLEALKGSYIGLDSSAKVLAYAMGQVGQVDPSLAAKARNQVDEHNQYIIDKQDEAAREWERSMEQAADDLRSTIESVLQPTLSEVWKPPEGEVPRIDEAARRLATVATSGFGSEWLDQLNQQFQGMSFWDPIAQAMQSGDEGALKAAATQFLAGPGVSQLWDIEVIKQKVRDDLARQNAQQQIVQTVMQQLSAEGLNVGAGQVQMAMGVSPVAQMIGGALDPEQIRQALQLNLGGAFGTSPLAQILLGDPAQFGAQFQSQIATALATAPFNPDLLKDSPVGRQVALAFSDNIREGLTSVDWMRTIADVWETDFKDTSILRPIVVPVGQKLGEYLAAGVAESEFGAAVVAALMTQIADVVAEMMGK